MRIDVITIFPQMFTSPMSASIVGLARERGLLDLHVHDLRDHTTDRHRSVDDYPYGGGPGMVMKPEPLFAAIRSLRMECAERARVVALTPSGPRFSHSKALDLAASSRLVLVCGRYEGFDERVYAIIDESLSIGDYVLTGGEIPAMVVIDAVTRLIPGVLGHSESTLEESFAEGLLEHPQYTRPAEFEGMAVPEVLMSGDHARIARFRRKRAIIRTARVRPDLLVDARLTEDEIRLADEARRESSGG